MSAGITSWEQFYELDRIVFDAEDRLKTGQGPSGIHYELMNLLRILGTMANGREDAIKQGKRLLREWEESQENKPKE